MLSTWEDQILCKWTHFSGALALSYIYKKQKIGQNQQSNIKTRDGGLLKDLQLKNMNATFLSLHIMYQPFSESSLKAENPEVTAEFSNRNANELEYSPQKRCWWLYWNDSPRNGWLPEHSGGASRLLELSWHKWAVIQGSVHARPLVIIWPRCWDVRSQDPWLKDPRLPVSQRFHSFLSRTRNQQKLNQDFQKGTWCGTMKGRLGLREGTTRQRCQLVLLETKLLW